MAARSARRARSQTPVILDEILLTSNSRVTGILKFERRFEIYLSVLNIANAVRVKDGKSLRNGMWNGVRNGIIMRNTIYVGNKLTEVFAPIF